jgi:hypothetical protein
VIYSLTLFWRSPPKWGWTEQYYREADSARQATDLGGPAGLTRFLALRSPPTELQAIRAEEVEGLRRIYVRRVDRTATTRDVSPDVAAVSVRCTVPFEGGGSRSVWIRGVPDQWVLRDRLTGLDRPAAALADRLARLWPRVRELRLRGRRLVQSAWFNRLHSAGAHPTEPTWTRVFVDTPPALAVGDRVYFGGRLDCCPIKAERPYWITEVTDAWVSLLTPWPVLLADQSMRLARMRVLTYEYPLLRAGEFAAFSTHATGAAYRPATWTYTGKRSPVDPCGRVVDYLRQTYRTTIRPYRDDPGIELPIVWYWTKPGAGEVPFDHPFGSRQWQLEDGQPPLIGEQYARRRTSGSNVTGLDAVGLCGSAEQWGFGPSVGDPLRLVNPQTGQPCCCGPGWRVLRGGGAGGGELRGRRLLAGGGAGGGVLFVGGALLKPIRGGGAGGGELRHGPMVHGGGAGGGTVFAGRFVAGGGAGGGELARGARLGQGGGAGGGTVQAGRVLVGGSAGGGLVVHGRFLAGGSAGGGELRQAPTLAGGSAGGGELRGADRRRLIEGGSAGGGEVEVIEDAGVTTPTCARPMSLKLRLSITMSSGSCGCVVTTLDFDWDNVDRWRCNQAGNVCSSAVPYANWYFLPVSAGQLSFSDGTGSPTAVSFNCSTGVTGVVSGPLALIGGYCTGSWSGTAAEV